MTDKQWQWARVFLSAPGVIGFFLPFAHYTSPFEYALHFCCQRLWFGLVLAASLAFPVMIWRLRHAVFGNLSRVEMIGCVALGIIGSILIAVEFGLAVAEKGLLEHNSSVLVPIFLTWLLCGMHIIVLTRYRRQVFTDTDAALAALMAGYLPAMTFVLLDLWSRWQLGAYFTLLTCLCYVGMIVATVRRLKFEKMRSVDG